ncbi:MAG: sel1 repeat family protein [Proteobacteria bacterium]|nr:sel1 repeat family protein [Pseudomonadota bacterium]
MRIFVLIGLLLCGLIGPARAGFEDGKALWLKTQYDKAFPELLPAAQAGNGEAQVMVGFMYYTGRGAGQDYAEAAKWYRAAADQGNATAQYRLGLMYRDGRGVAAEPETAVAWYRKAADQGHAMAQYRLGFRYANGQGLTEDFVEAYRWLTLSVANGAEVTPAMIAAKVRKITRKMTPEQIAEGEKRAQEWKPTGPK